MHVAVVIVGFRNPADIVKCLASLNQSDYADFEVVVCENGGRPAFEALTERLPKVLSGGQSVRILLAPHNLGYGGGVNLGLAASAGADAWWVLNPDTQPDRAALGALVARLSVGDCEAVGGILHFPDGKVESFGGRWWPWGASPRPFGYGGRLDSPVDVTAIEPRLSYVSGASMMISRRFVSATGPMREDYFLYCEEVEWGLRAKARGLRFGLAPEAKVLHYQGATTGSVEQVSRRPRMPVYLDTRNKILVTRDRFPACLPSAALVVIATSVLRFARRGAWRQIGYAVSGWLAGLRGERGAPKWLAAAEQAAPGSVVPTPMSPGGDQRAS